MPDTGFHPNMPNTHVVIITDTGNNHREGAFRWRGWCSCGFCTHVPTEAAAREIAGGHAAARLGRPLKEGEIGTPEELSAFAKKQATAYANANKPKAVVGK